MPEGSVFDLSVLGRAAWRRAQGDERRRKRKNSTGAGCGRQRRERRIMQCRLLFYSEAVDCGREGARASESSEGEGWQDAC